MPEKESLLYITNGVPERRRSIQQRILEINEEIQRIQDLLAILSWIPKVEKA